MSDHDMLLRVILQNPADDTARLVYADWCDENGRGWRAELIRLQVGGCTRDDLRAAVKRWERSAENISAMRHAFLPSNRWRWRFGEEPGRFQAGSGAVVRRGFVDEVLMPADQFYHDARDLFKMHPVTTVRLEGVLSYFIQYPVVTGEHAGALSSTEAAQSLRRRVPDWLMPFLMHEASEHDDRPYDASLLWSSCEAAMAAWSDACVAYGRSQAKLGP